MMLARIRCYIRDRHMPTRYFLGGFKCTGEGYVSIVSSARGSNRSGLLST
jgi:hypothetical protein